VRTKGIYSSTTSHDVLGWFDEAAVFGEWLVITGHAARPHNDGWEPAPMDVYETSIRLAAEARASGNAWVASFENVAKYWRQRTETAIETGAADGGQIELRLATSLNPRVYNHPLSLTVEVPKTWGRVVVGRGVFRRVVPSVVSEGTRRVRVLVPARQRLVRLRPAKRSRARR